MEERSYTQDHFLTITRTGNPTARLEGIRQEVAMREHGAFRNSCCSVRILKNGKVITCCSHWQIEHFYSTLSMRIQHGTHHMQHLIFAQFLLGERRLRMMGVKLSKGIEPVQHWRKVIGRAGNNDMFQRSICANSSHNGIEHIEHHDKSRTRISQLVLHLTLSIERIGGYNDRASSQGTIKSDRILRHIR